MPARPHRLIVAIAALSTASLSPRVLAAAAQTADRPALGETRVFARVPYPGQPLGIVVDRRTVRVTAASLNQPDVTEWPVRAYDLETGQPLPDETLVVSRPGPAAMALSGMARDASGRIYVVDMNGRILRTTDARLPSGLRRWEVYGTIPGAGKGGRHAPWPVGMSMPLDITFDRAGNAYIADLHLPVIWRIPPGGGEAQAWFSDPALVGAPLGVAAARVAPDGRELYFSLCHSSSVHHPTHGVIYRLPIDDPTVSQLTEVYDAPGSCPVALAFGASGKLYATLFSTSQVVVIRPDGTEEWRFPSQEANDRQEIPYDQPGFVTFDGRGWLLVANTSLTTPQSKNWAILKTFVADTAAPQIEPAVR